RVNAKDAATLRTADVHQSSPSWATARDTRTGARVESWPFRTGSSPACVPLVPFNFGANAPASPALPTRRGYGFAPFVPPPPPPPPASLGFMLPRPPAAALRTDPHAAPEPPLSPHPPP